MTWGFVRRRCSRRLGALLALVLLDFGAARSSLGDDPEKVAPARLEHFEKRIRPLLAARCFKCHSAAEGSLEAPKANLRLDTREGWLAGGDSGPAVAPGRPEESLLVKAIRYNGEIAPMPPDAKLPQEEIDLLSQWIEEGALAPDSGQPQLRSDTTPIDWDEARRFWSFRPIANPLAPSVRETSWPRDPIDHFILSRLEAEGLAPARDADLATLKRRVSYALTGLPPRWDELGENVAYETVVDRCLASPEFGEHWARHWLDLTCYADTIDSAQMPLAHAWRYRDYVVASFNADKPLDVFAAEQLAGDLMPAESDGQRRERIIATGFLALGPWSLAEQDKEKLRMDIVDHQITLVGRVFLGMTLDCARCHSHKFDPIPHRDYYALAGVLGNGEVLRGIWRSNLSFPLLVELPETESEREARIAATPAWEAEHAAASAELAVRRDAREAIEAASPPATAEAIAVARKAFEEQDGAVRFLEFHRPSPPFAHAVAERPTPVDARVNLRGDHRNLGETAPRGALTIVDLPPLAPGEQSGRLHLAHWLFDAGNPLPARVLANRIWRHMVGVGLVRSVDYFGALGEKPSHPDLLEHLATRLRGDGWSVKSLLRAIAMSRTFQLASVDVAPNDARDPENRLLWRAHRRRLSGEMIRDTLLLAGGELSSARGGPALPIERRENLSPGCPVNPPTVGALKLTDEEAKRRTLYMPFFRREQNGELEILTLFDFPSTSVVTGARRETTVPTQSLFLLNSPMIRDRALAIARRVVGHADRTDDRIEGLWRLLVQRSPSSTELQLAHQFLGAEPDESRWTELVRGLIASNAFLYRL